MTTVAFVSYEYAGNPRRVGPIPLEQAESMARELSRREDTKEVFVEEWGLLMTRKVEKP